MVSKIGMSLNMSSNFRLIFKPLVLNQDLALNYDLLIAVLPYLTELVCDYTGLTE